MSTPELTGRADVASATGLPSAAPGSRASKSIASPSRDRIRAGWQPLLVWLAWLVMTANALRFIVQYGSRNMFMDDLWLVLPRLHPDGLTWSMLWSANNEHREPLPELLQYGLYRATGDVRSGLWLTVLVLSGTAFVLIVLARRLRGRLTWTDVLFPVLWLHTGNAENLLMGYQITLMLPTALVTLVMMLIATAPEGLRPEAAITCAIAMVCLPLCGGPGFLQAPMLAVWAFATGHWMRRSADDASRRSGTMLIAAAVITVGMLALYLVGFRNPPGMVHTYNFAAIGELTLIVLGLALGPAAEAWKPWVGVGVLIFGLSGWALAVRAWSTRSSERVRAFGIACCMCANVAVAFGIGVGRSGTGGPYAFPIRYVMLAAPLVCAAYVSWTLYGPPAVRSIVRAGACATCAVAFLFVGCREGERIGSERKRVMDAVERDIVANVPASELIDRYGAWLDNDPHRLFLMYSLMAKQRIEPFDRASDFEIRSFGHEQPDVIPSRVDGMVMVADATGSSKGLLLARGSQIFFDVPDTAVKMKVAFAFPSTDDETLRATTPRFFVTMSDSNFKQRELLLTRALDPTTPAAARTVQVVELDLRAHAGRKIAMQFIMPQTAGGKVVYGRIEAVRFE